MARTTRNKFGAIKTRGMASKLEAAVFDILKLKELVGEVENIKAQQSVTLIEKNGHSIRWKIDFSFVVRATGLLEYAEAKGVETSDYKLKLKLYKMNPPAALTIYKGNWRKPFVAERIEAA